MNNIAHVPTPLTTADIHRKDNLQDVADSALEAARMMCGMEACPYEDPERRHQFQIVLEWRKGVGKHRRVPSNIAELAALNYQMTRGTNGQPTKRFGRRKRHLA